MSWFGSATCDDVDQASCCANLHRLDAAALGHVLTAATTPEPTIERYSDAKHRRAARTFEPRQVSGIALAS